MQKKQILKSPRKDDRKVMTWDCIYFGSYPQSDATGKTKEPIKWRVLSVKGNDAFLVADLNLDMQQYNETKEAVTWETCTMRSWLNGYGSDYNVCGIDYSEHSFMNRAFTPVEQEAIMVTNVINYDNPVYKTKGGNDTQDKVFLLAYQEVTKASLGFDPKDDNFNDARMPKQSAYVEAGGSIYHDVKVGYNNRLDWWLRTPGEFEDKAMITYNIGITMDCGLNADRCDNAVRPALHLNLAHTDCWSYAGTVSSKDLEYLRVSKGRTSYEVGDVLSLENLTVTALYSDDDDKKVTNYTTNVADIDMSVEGMKELVISYNEKGITKTATVDIEVTQRGSESIVVDRELLDSLHNPRTDWKGIVTWDCVYFGNYPQSDITGQTKEPIKWRVLSVEGNDAFLVADKNLDVRRYNDTDEGVTWETCTIRSWLNGYGSDSNICGTDFSENNFIDCAFTDEEQKAIKTTLVVNEDNWEHKTPGGNNTKDKVYLLSVAEVHTSFYGFSLDVGRSHDCAALRIDTAYVAAGGTFGSERERYAGKGSEWALRTPGSSPDTMASVLCNGMKFDSGTHFGMEDTSVCPAIHLNLAATNCWSYVGTVDSDEAPDTLGGKLSLVKRVATRRVRQAMLQKEFS